MGSKFNLTPLIIRNEKGEIYDVKDLKMDYKTSKFKILEIRTLEDIPIVEISMNDTTLLDIDKNLGTVALVYKSANGEFLNKEVVDLLEKEKLIESKSEEEILYNKIKVEVQFEMDMPKGTELEKAKHTECLKKSISDENSRKYIISKIRKILMQKYDDLEFEKVDKYCYKIFADLYGMGVLQELDDDIEIGEIMVNASVYPKFDCKIYYIKNGKKYKYDKTFKNLEDMKQVFSRTVQFQNKELNGVNNAIVEAVRPNQDRVNIIIPRASEQWVLNIRKFTNFIPSLDMMYQSGTVTPDINELLKVLVKGKSNIGIGGPMGTGKTTFINFLLSHTPPMERKVIIASVPETDTERVLAGHDVCIFNVDEEKGFTFEKHVKASLRTTADRVIIPESRGGEFKQLYEANLKTKGNMFTAHAIDDYGFLDMCVDMYMSSPDCGNESAEYIKDKLCKGIDIIIMMCKLDGKIRIKSISEVEVDENYKFVKMNRLYEFKFDPENPTEGVYSKTGNKITDALKRRLNEQGVPMSLLKEF